MQASAPRRLGGSVLVLGALLFAAALGWVGGQGSLVLMGALFFGLLLVACALSWTFGVPVLLAISTIDGFFKHLLSESSAVYILKDVMLGAVLAGMLVHVAMHRDELTARSWHGFIPWLLFYAYMASQVLHPALGFSGAIAGFRARAFFSLMYLVGAVYFVRRERLQPMANIVIVLGVLAAGSGIAQHLMGPAWDRLGPGFILASQKYSMLVNDPNLVQHVPAALATSAQTASRAYGALVDPTALGLFCAFGMLFAVAAFARTRGGGRLVLLASIVIMAIGLFESGTRSAMVGLAVGLLLTVAILLTQRGSRGMAILSLIAISGIGIYEFFGSHNALSIRGTSNQSIAYAMGTRDRSRDIVLGDALRYPLGHGLGASEAGGADDSQQTLAVDDIYLAYLYETGIVGLALFLLVQLTFFVLALRAFRRDPDNRSVYIGFIGGQSAMLVASLATQGAFDYAPLAQIFWLFCGALSL
jgi:hypothetical protein